VGAPAPARLAATHPWLFFLPKPMCGVSGSRASAELRSALAGTVRLFCALYLVWVSHTCTEYLSAGDGNSTQNIALEGLRSPVQPRKRAGKGGSPARDAAGALIGSGAVV